MAFVSVQDVVGNFFGSVGKIPGFVGLAADYFSFIDSSIPEEQGSAEPEKSATPQELSGAIGTIELKDISFRYPHSEKDAVKSASLTIRQGEVVSLVGVNGSGKTTLVKLLLGIYEPERGEIRYNGMDLRTIRKESLYSHAALLTQDFALYNLSLEENIALADIGQAGDRERIREALRRVDLEGALDKAGTRGCCNGQEDCGRVLGREFRGPAFSEGQKQRLALARVLFTHRELVILDEPTSALDSLQENRILEEFLRLAKAPPRLSSLIGWVCADRWTKSP
nr:ABC transporter ATP-binding protein [uncultured Acetatifactor sp.]